jgi:hypothetical protein
MAFATVVPVFDSDGRRPVYAVVVSDALGNWHTTISPFPNMEVAARACSRYVKLDGIDKEATDLLAEAAKLAAAGKKVISVVMCVRVSFEGLLAVVATRGNQVEGSNAG